jgi:hypothetical protein
MSDLAQFRFCLNGSKKSLEDLELAALNRAANLMKQIKAELAVLVEETATARLSRFLRENREEIFRAGNSCQLTIEFDLAGLLDEPKESP